MSNIESFVIGTIIYVIIAFVAYWWTDVKKWALKPFNYEPWTCYKCFRFWVSVWVTIILVMSEAFMMAFSLFVLAGMDAVALHIKENNTDEV